MRNAPSFIVHASPRARSPWRWLAILAFLALAALPDAARADCAASGLTVLCAPPGTGGFDAGATNGYRLTVAPAGVVDDSGTFAINLLNNNTVFNYGVVNATTLGAAGLFVDTNNTIVNYGGVAASGDSTAGIAAQGNSTVTNYGLVAASGPASVGVTFQNAGTVNNIGVITSTGDNGIAVYGLGALNLTNSGVILATGNNGVAVVGGDNSTLSNSGLISTTGSGGSAVTFNDNASITNSGVILNTGDSNPTIQVNDNGTIRNSGTVTSVSDFLGPVIVGRDGNTIINTGSISGTTLTNSGVGVFGVIVVRDNNTIINNGTVTAGDNVFSAIGAEGSNNTIVNNGRIVGGFGAAGIQLGAGGTGNTVTNNGTITVGEFGLGMSINDDGAVVTNNGTITAGESGTAVDFCGCVTGFTFNNNGLLRAPGSGYAFNSGGAGTMNVNNNGTMDGPVLVDGGLLNNRGKILLSDSATAVGAQVISVSSGGTLTNFSTGSISLRANSAGVADTVNVDNLVLNSAGGGGTLQIAPQSGLYGTTTTYTGIVSANTSMAGTFNSVVSTSPFLRAFVLYNANSVDVSLVQIPFNAVANLNGNQQAVGAALQAGYTPNNLTPQAQALYSSLFSSTSANVLNQLSGEGTSATQGSAFGAANLFQGALADQSAAWRTTGGYAGSGTVLVAANQVAQANTMTDAGPSALFLAPDTPIRVWTMGFGSYQSLAGDAATGASGTNVQTGGAAVGIERQFTPDFLAGFALGGSGSSFSAPNANTNGSLKGVQAGVYATKSWGPYYATGSLSYGYFDNSTTRTITGIGPTETATGSYASNQFSGRIEAGRRFTVEEDYGVTPFAAVEGSNLWQSGYTESTVNANGGAGVLGLTYKAQQVGSLPTTLGFQADAQIKGGDGKTWAPYLRLGWQHEFMTTRNVNAALTAIPDNGFTAQGARAASDTAMIDLGLKVLYSKNLSMFINGSSQMAGSFLSYGGKAGLMWAF